MAYMRFMLRTELHREVHNSGTKWHQKWHQNFPQGTSDFQSPERGHGPQACRLRGAIAPLGTHTVTTYLTKWRDMAGVRGFSRDGDVPPTLLKGLSK